MDPREIEERVRGYMSERRFRHTLGVKHAAERLADANGFGGERVVVAALLHDVARDMPLEEMQRLVRDRYLREKLPREIFENPLLLHPFASCEIAASDFRVTDGEVLRSIERHTTGGSAMGLLEKVIFVADYIEAGRSFRGVKTARALSSRSLDAAMLYIYRSVIRHLLTRGRYICEDSLRGYNELILKRGTKHAHGNQDV